MNKIVKQVKDEFIECNDLIYKKIKFGFKTYHIFYLETITSSDKVSEYVLNGIAFNKNINNIKKNTKKSLREDCISLVEDSKNEIKYFNLDDWLEWVDYKLAKETKITLATFKKNLKQLINFGENAKQSIDTSISSNWSGLFAIRTQKDVKQGLSMTEDNKSDFRGVSVRNKEECNWFLDFLKGDDKE